MTTHSPLARRGGLTLTETLVAMFVAAIGFICLLALFPLGALQMGQALKDSRCTELATNAESLMRAHWRSILEPMPNFADAALFNPNSATSPDNTAFNNPTNAVPPFVAIVGQSAPVFVDPIGHFSNVGDIGGLTGLPRRNLPGTVSFAQRFRLCTLLDDMTFDESGAPVVSGSRVERAGRYNWMAVLQRENNAIAYEAKLTILVFDGRAAGYIAPNAERSLVIPPPAPAIVIPAIDPLVGSTTLTVGTAGTMIQSGKGRWIGLWTSGGTRQARHLNFYRVVSVDESVANTVTFELQTPIKPGHSRALQLAGDTPPATQVLVFSGLAEVFERAPLTGH